MSQVYALEPPTEGKCVIHTTHGEIEIELFPREAPKATRNFVQLCLENYYDGCEFTRCIPEFMIQTGDPTNTGSGGESTYGGTFKDEFHSRLKFNVRGRVAMANAGRRDSNGSQFFVTLGECGWLDRKHTIFGKIAGATMYNAIQIGQVETQGDRPVDPAPRVLRTEVLGNPFPDIVPRVKAAEETGAEEDFRKVEAQGKKKKKKLNLLSFGEEAAEEEATIEEVGLKGMKSSHDVGGDATLVDADADETRETLERTAREKALAREKKQRVKERLKDMGEDVSDEERDEDGGGRGWDEGAKDDAAAFQDQMRRKMIDKRRELRDVEGGLEEIEKDIRSQADALNSKRDKRELKEKRRAEKAAREEERKTREASKLKKLGLGKRAVREEDAALMTSDQIKRIEAKARKSRVVDREKDTLARLAAFNAKQSQAAPSTNKADENAQEEGREGAVGVSRFVPQGLYYMDDEEDDDSDWRSHKLAFVPDAKRNAGSYEADVNDYEYHDPLLEKGKGKFAKKTGAQ
jgi:peptidyl-prolyl cis-trans isomerase SDCCAG10